MNSTQRYFQIAMTMALIMGIFLPAAETVRRIHQVITFTDIPAWIDDYFLGMILIVAALLARKNPPRNGYFLIAAWGIAVGALFLSFMGQFQYVKGGNTEPGIFSAAIVLVAKGLILTSMLFGLYFSIQYYRKQ